MLKSNIISKHVFKNTTANFSVRQLSYSLLAKNKLLYNKNLVKINNINDIRTLNQIAFNKNILHQIYIPKRHISNELNNNITKTDRSNKITFRRSNKPYKIIYNKNITTENKSNSSKIIGTVASLGLLGGLFCFAYVPLFMFSLMVPVVLVFLVIGIIDFYYTEIYKKNK